MSLNERALDVVRSMVADAAALGLGVSQLDGGTRLVDCGVKSPGSLDAGLRLARVCLADLATVALEPIPADSPAAALGVPQVVVATDEPVRACLASQYAGWEVKGEKYFAMGSGPMRAAAGREPLFDDIGCRESAGECVGVLESGKLPPAAVAADVAARCGISPDRLTLLVAPTSSSAGTLQIVARSVETALHKLHELKFDLSRIVSGRGTAPLPPLAADDLAAIGVTNDAILYGAEVTLRLRGDFDSLAAIGPQIPSAASRDYGRPFGETLARFNHDFYQVDPLLFSPAAVTLVDDETGRALKFGRVNLDLLQQSFAAVDLARIRP